MKKFFLIVTLITSLSVFSQIPSYYNDVNLNLSGQSLKNELATKIISTHNNFLSYTPGVWNALKQTDLDPNNSSRVLLIYGWDDSDSNITNDRTRGRDANGGSSGDWNREHVYPRSLGNPNLGSSGPGSDAHSLRPCDGSRNSSRSNRKFAAGSGAASYITPQGHWYPGDEWKGDVARMMMYMYLRYGNQTLPTNVGVGSTVATDSNMISLFLQWNAEDPVSDLEKQRNPILAQEQGNRNPFIDNPAFATQIWGGPQAEDLFNTGGGSTDTQAPSIPSGLIASNISQNSVDLTWNASTDNVAVTGYNIYNGTTLINTTSSTSYNVTGLTAGTSYSFSVRAFDATGNVSGNSNSVSVTTTSGGTGGGTGTTTELIISEYVEGSSFNKAIEIANFTGSTVNLSGYSLQKTTNGNNSWGSTLNLSGQLANGEVYVIAHSSASSAITSNANQTISGGVVNFNGNDAVALFKNSSIIDVVGTSNSSSNFGKDVTLRRKSSITSPNTSYTTSEWDSLANNTSDGLGTHSVDGGGSGPGPDTLAPSPPSNLGASNTTQTSVNLSWSASTDNIAVTGYEVFRGSTRITTITNTNYNVTGLTANTTYTFTIRAIDAAGNVSNSSNAITVTTQSATAVYCSSKGNSTNYEYIDNVTIGGISNSTAANGGYGDFTNLTGNLSFGSNTIIVSAAFVGSPYTEYWKVWIDFNQNGTFESGEEVVSGSSSSAGNLSYTFTIPNTAKTGATRMRVSMKWNGAPTACETFSYGEVEDYTVNIGTSSRNSNTSTPIQIDEELSNEEPIFKADIYPNPTTDFINISLRDAREATFKIMNYVGQIIKVGSTDKAIDVSSFTQGIYILEISDGQRSFTKKIIKN
ncbi:endonuclease [Tenacibaculum agarivorans]|uniref:endonuclease n=1 Tax=Tenacibaculum agarivorans TaxID=1908389 RepID=UPI00094BA7DA|nr:endonuclease [Tenacibaculum agarivorans]